MMVGPRVILRDWRPEDALPFVLMNADPVAMEFFVRRLSIEESKSMLSRIRAFLEERGWGLWAMEVEGAFAGFVGLSIPPYETPFSPFVEIGWRLRPEYWGKGYATEGACLAMLRGFETVGLSEIVSFTALLNRRSQAVMKRLGMTRDPSEDFNHPMIEGGHALLRHGLYRLANTEANRRHLAGLLSGFGSCANEGAVR